MNIELDKFLCEKYPKIFADRYKPMTMTAMCWGIECGDGWFNILNQLCGNIQHHIDWTHRSYENAVKHNKMITDMRAGNFESFNQYMGTSNEYYKEQRKVELLEDSQLVIKTPCSQVVADQVKEKFGTLRFYYSGGDNNIDGMVRMAESMSGVTCEECGDPGSANGPGWIRTLCVKHKKAKDVL
jgi:hypothetical protein